MTDAELFPRIAQVLEARVRRAPDQSGDEEEPEEEEPEEEQEACPAAHPSYQRGSYARVRRRVLALAGS